jgi:hypothetical protein
MKSSKYLAWVRTLPCALCHTDQGIQAHHQMGTKLRGTGTKVSDHRTIPLCSLCHSELHDHGYKTWEKKYGVTQDFLILRVVDKAIFEGRLAWQ